MNLSVYGDAQPTPDEWAEPFVEVSLYDDDPYPFSARSREDILEASVDCRSPWHGCMRMNPIEMNVVGLARLHSAVQLDESHVDIWHGLPISAGYVARGLAEWLRALRFHQAVKRYLDQEGLARHLPVIVGSHGLPPHFEGVYYPSPSHESAAEAKVHMEAVREAERRAYHAEKVRKLWETADAIRETRKVLCETRFWPSRHMRKLRALYEGREATVANLNKLGLPKRPSWRIANDDEFERFLKRFYVDAFLE